MRIFKRVAAFLKELSLDNDHIGVVWRAEVDQLVKGLVDSLFIDNADFAANMLTFAFQVHLRKNGLPAVTSPEFLSLLDDCIEKIYSLEEGLTPQDYFMKHFAQSFKLADQDNEEEENDDHMEDEGGAGEILAAKDDKVTQTLEYKKWRALSKATASITSLLNDFIQAVSSEGAEDDYEEVEEFEGAAGKAA
jgi:hypothetical protein